VSTLKSAEENKPSYAAYIGLDWADQKHDVCLQATGSTEVEHLVVERLRLLTISLQIVGLPHA